MTSSVRTPAHLHALVDALAELATDKSHHASTSKFVNPWPSFHAHGLSSFPKLLMELCVGGGVPGALGRFRA